MKRAVEILIYSILSASGLSGANAQGHIKDGIRLHPEAYMIWSEHLKYNGYLN